MSLPHLLGLELSDLFVATNDITPTPTDIAAWSERLAALPGLKVGHRLGCRPEFIDDAKRSFLVAKRAPVRQCAGIP